MGTGEIYNDFPIFFFCDIQVLNIYLKQEISLRGKKMKYEKMNNLFLRQSYLDSWEDYERSLKKKALSNGIILTASNEA